MKQLEGKVALITGGGTGIGRGIGLMFAEEGANIAVNYSRSQSEANQTVDDIKKRGGKALAIKADVSKDIQVKDLVACTVKEFGRLDILVNNAGITAFVPYESLDDLTEEIWDRLIAVNLKGVFFCCRAAVPHLKAVGNGVIINVASTAGLTGMGSSIAYCASKAGAISVTRSLARSLAPEVRVNAIAPGVVDTRWIEGKDEFRKWAEDNTPLKRVATTEDIAHAVLGFAINQFITGQVYIVDGGRTI